MVHYAHRYHTAPESPNFLIVKAGKGFYPVSSRDSAYTLVREGYDWAANHTAVHKISRLVIRKGRESFHHGEQIQIAHGRTLAFEGRESMYSSVDVNCLHDNKYCLFIV